MNDKEIRIIFELKYVEKAAFDDGCRKALKQINDRRFFAGKYQKVWICF
ncbi:hypothetical protein [Parablautia intestinalis]|nr:hypothetical protein [Parablautia intestinalis]